VGSEIPFTIYDRNGFNDLKGFNGLNDLTSERFDELTFCKTAYCSPSRISAPSQISNVKNEWFEYGRA